jgi:hypothetical protein
MLTITSQPHNHYTTATILLKLNVILWLFGISIFVEAKKIDAKDGCYNCMHGRCKALGRKKNKKVNIIGFTDSSR